MLPSSMQKKQDSALLRETERGHTRFSPKKGTLSHSLQVNRDSKTLQI